MHIIMETLIIDVFVCDLWTAICEEENVPIKYCCLLSRRGWNCNPYWNWRSRSLELYFLSFLSNILTGWKAWTGRSTYCLRLSSGQNSPLSGWLPWLSCGRGRRKMDVAVQNSLLYSSRLGPPLTEPLSEYLIIKNLNKSWLKRWWWDRRKSIDKIKDSEW